MRVFKWETEKLGNICKNGNSIKWKFELHLSAKRYENEIPFYRESTVYILHHEYLLNRKFGCSQMNCTRLRRKVGEVEDKLVVLAGQLKKVQCLIKPFSFQSY